MSGSVPKILCSLFLSFCYLFSAAQGQRDTSVIIDRYFYIQDDDTMRVDHVYPSGQVPASVSYQSDKALYDSLMNSASGIMILNRGDTAIGRGTAVVSDAGPSDNVPTGKILVSAVAAVAVLTVLLLLYRRKTASRKEAADSGSAFDSESVRSISDLVDSISQLRGFVSDKGSLLSAMLASYSVTHPEFVSRLRTYGLTDQEIGYCCLYAAGLNGKDITFILNDGGHGHYNTASALRSKFGLRDRSVNLSQWLKSLLAETDNVKS